MEATPKAGGDPTSQTPPASPTLACQTGPGDVSEHLGDSAPDAAGDLSWSPGERVLPSAETGNWGSKPGLTWEAAGPKAQGEEREPGGFLLAEQSEGCATGVPAEEEERQGGTAELAVGSSSEVPGAGCETRCSRGGVGDRPVLPGENTPRQDVGSPSRLPPGKEERAAGAGRPGGEGIPVPAVEGAGSTSACTDGSAGADSSLMGAGQEPGSDVWERAPLESREPPPTLELLCRGVEELSPTAWAEELVVAGEDTGSPQQQQCGQGVEEEEGGLRSDSPKAEQTGAGTPSQASPGAEKSWDALFNDDGDCLDPRLLEEVRPASRLPRGFAGMVAAACWDTGTGIRGGQLSLCPPGWVRGGWVAPGARGPLSCLRCHHAWDLHLPPSSWFPSHSVVPVKAGGDLPSLVHKAHPVKPARAP